MLIISGTMDVEAEDHDRVVEVVSPIVEQTLAEDGNITYGFWAHVNEPGTFHIYEEWQDQDALDAHMGSAHMAEFMTAMGSLKVTGIDIHRHEVSESSKFM